jgi:hypothetical protein
MASLQASWKSCQLEITNTASNSGGTWHTPCNHLIKKSKTTWHVSSAYAVVGPADAVLCRCLTSPTGPASSPSAVGWQKQQSTVHRPKW